MDFAEDIAKQLGECPTCKGKGWVSNDGGGIDPYGHHPCKDCHMTGKDIEQFLALSGLSKQPKPESDVFWVGVACANANEWR